MALNMVAAGAALLALACASGAVSAQVYKWVDAKGVVHYSDTPPPGRKASALGAAAPLRDPARLPPALAGAAAKHPVTLYTTSACGVCDQGRALLAARGIPFAEKTVLSNEDQQQLREAGGAGRLPLLLVGRTKLVGFEADAWHQALAAAAYPARSVLPPGYRQPEAEPAAPGNPADNAAAKKRAEAARRKRADAPPGFQF